MLGMNKDNGKREFKVEESLVRCNCKDKSVKDRFFTDADDNKHGVYLFDKSSGASLRVGSYFAPIAAEAIGRHKLDPQTFARNRQLINQIRGRPNMCPYHCAAELLDANKPIHVCYDLLPCEESQVLHDLKLSSSEAKSGFDVYGNQLTRIMYAALSRWSHHSYEQRLKYIRKKKGICMWSKDFEFMREALEGEEGELRDAIRKHIANEDYIEAVAKMHAKDLVLLPMMRNRDRPPLYCQGPLCGGRRQVVHELVGRRPVCRIPLSGLSRLCARDDKPVYGHGPVCGPAVPLFPGQHVQGFAVLPTDKGRHASTGHPEPRGHILSGVLHRRAARAGHAERKH
jgi:hypothetical protein